MAASAAVVTTLALPLPATGKGQQEGVEEADAEVAAATGATDDVLRSFLGHYRRLGFSSVMLFFDQMQVHPGHAWVRICEEESALEDGFKVHWFLRSDEDLSRAQQEVCPLMDADQNEVPIRQRVNAEYALHLAQRSAAHRARWILHVDIDELLVLPAHETAASHYEELDRRGIGAFKYVNHEGVPESRAVGNYFAEVTLFRRNHLVLPLGSGVQGRMAEWAKRTDHGQYFLAYDNGKSAVRTISGARTTSVHAFSLPSTSGLRSATNSYDVRDGLHVELVKEDESPSLAKACILHYVVCGAGWVKWKYRHLGDFTESWQVDAHRRVPIAPCFHLACKMASRDGGLDALYDGQVLAPGPAFVDASIRDQVCFRAAPLGTKGELGAVEEPDIDKETPNDYGGSRDSAKAPRGTLGFDKAWLLSNIARDYL